MNILKKLLGSTTICLLSLNPLIAMEHNKKRVLAKDSNEQSGKKVWDKDFYEILGSEYESFFLDDDERYSVKSVPMYHNEVPQKVPVPFFVNENNNIKIQIPNIKHVIKEVSQPQQIFFVDKTESAKIALPKIQQVSKRLTRVCLITPYKTILYVDVNVDQSLKKAIESFNQAMPSLMNVTFSYFIGERELATPYNERHLFKNAAILPQELIQAYFYWSRKAPREVPHCFAITIKDPSSHCSYLTVPLEKTFTALQADALCKKIFHDKYWSDKNEKKHEKKYGKDTFITSLQVMWFQNGKHHDLKSFGSTTLESLNFFHHSDFMNKDHIKFICPQMYCYKNKQ